MTAETDGPRSRLGRALDLIGAVVTREEEDHEVDFSFDGLGGFAHDEDGLFRASFFLDFDPDTAEAEQWVLAHDQVPYASAQLIDVGDGMTLRVLVDLPYDNKMHLQLAGRTVRALHAAWLTRTVGGSALGATLASAGILMPPFGSTPPEDIHTYGRWSWGSRYVPPGVLYMFEVGFVATQLVRHGPVFAMGHAGHGINSYGLSVVTTSAAGAVAAYVQHGYGGGYANPVADLIRINTTYSRLHLLWQALAERPTEAIRWLLILSEFRQTYGIIDLDRLRNGDDLEMATDYVDNEAQLFDAVAGRLRVRDLTFESSGRI